MHTPPSDSPIPTVADVDRIAALSDPVIRNLQITQSYHELALAMTARVQGANWCTFATWASKQAGQTIRKEDLARILENAVFAAQSEQGIVAAAQSLGSNRSPAEIQQAVVQALDPRSALDRASDAVARGNRKVYEEIGREFARFYATCLHDSTFDAGRVASFCEGLRPGDPPDGQRLLRQAFARCYQAFFEPDAKARAELMLLANVEIGLHEQTRLQPEIAEAMNAAVVDRRRLRTRIIFEIFPFRGVLMWSRLFLLRLFGRRSLFDTLLDSLVDEVRRQMRFIITEFMMTLALPRGVRLRLGWDVPGEFPMSLKQIALPELRDLLGKVDPTPDSVRESGADDWANLPDRLHFIVDMFRCYHESAELFDPPFTAAQVADLKAGRRAAGPL